MENKVLDIIISLLEGFKEEKEYKQHQLTSISNGRKYCIYNADYLLNQILRNLYLPDDHYLLSKGAKELWDKLSPTGENGGDIQKYWYREKLVVKCKTPVKVNEFKGASNKGIERTLEYGNSFIFRDIFHLEHMIPIEVIIKQLERLVDENNLTYDSVSEVLDKIYICRITKEEDRNIDPKYKSDRSFDLQEVKQLVYSEAKIEII